MQNKPNFRKSQMNVSIFSQKAYENKSNWTLGENKPNSNPISEKPKMSANVFVTKDYENETAFRLQKNKPNLSTWLKTGQSQSLVKDLNALVNAWMFISKARPKLRTNPKNLLGIMPAKEGKIDLKHSFYGSAFLFLPQRHTEIKIINHRFHR